MFYRNLLSLALCGALAAPSALAQDDSEMTREEKYGYSVGVKLGDFVKDGKDYIDLDAMIQGLRDLMEDKDLKLDQADIDQSFATFQTTVQQAREHAAKSKGEEFLKENVKKEGVTELSSGLQYRVIEEGTGESPESGDTVKVDYKGTFIDGTEFDSSYKRGQPAEFGVTQVIPGWTEALQLMKEGGKWELYIPHNLAYGPQGRPSIPPYSTLIFEVELLEIVED